jgi:predicted glycogen debranching enzyme
LNTEHKKPNLPPYVYTVRSHVVLTMQQKMTDIPALSVVTENCPVNELLAKEWLLTNGRGSYASSTIAGCNTRSYHGLLIGSLNPPVNRIMALSNCLEMTITEGQTCNFSTFEFNDKFSPEGYRYLKSFQQDTGVHFNYEPGTFKLTKSIYLPRLQDKVIVVYNFTGVRQAMEFIIRPFAGLRDFHGLQKSYANLLCEQDAGNLLIRYDEPYSCRLSISCTDAQFKDDPQWWYNFVYRTNRERGQDYTEDLWTPGFYKSFINKSCKIIFQAQLTDAGSATKPQISESKAQGPKLFLDKTIKDLKNYRKKLLKQNAQVNPEQQYYNELLCLAADQFIVKCGLNSDHGTSIVAGYPWFADWGRDAFISIPGLLLSTGRFEEAMSVLCTFAAWADDGMVPSRFDDYSATAGFNSVDASLWFVNAAFEYLKASGDSKGFIRQLLPTIIWIIESYSQGTKFDIHADDDALITAGDNQTQLTWMDARFDGVSFTPRGGKAVEINALWYNCLCRTAHLCHIENIKNAEQYYSTAKMVKDSFCKLFWNESRNYLNDCIAPDGSVDESLRPNQIIAVSLEYSPLTQIQQKAVVDSVQRNLLTPYGLRTLDPASVNYRGRYTGPQKQRDQAYHQGTVWPYLMGPFIESYLKVNKFSPESKLFACDLLLPLLRHLTDDGCIGSISEIFDGDAPQLPKGCFAQAWSVSELLRAYLLIHNSEQGTKHS